MEKQENKSNKQKQSNEMKKKLKIKKERVKESRRVREEFNDLKEEIESTDIREVVIERKVGFNYVEVIVIMIITLILGGVIGSFVTYISRSTDTSNPVIHEVPKDLKEFISTYNNIITDYYEEIDHEKLLEAGINGMLEFLDDDYSLYMDYDASQSFNEQVEGKYTGIGVEIIQNDNNTVSVSRVFEDSPAFKAGLQPGDIFARIDDVDVTGKTSSEISNLIKNSDTDQVSILIIRNGEEKNFHLSLQMVEIESVNSKVFEKNGKRIGYLEISIFASNTDTQFERKLLELEGTNIDSLIIDVRDNSGGYLSTVTNIASLFMNKSKVIYQLDTRGIVEQIYSNTKVSRDYSISVLINQNSASASEILAAALQESYGATIVGVNSFGKGTVQKAIQLESGATIKYTIQKWLTPNGNWVNEVGITPDVEVFMDGDYYQNPNDESDNQLQRALEELVK